MCGSLKHENTADKIGHPIISVVKEKPRVPIILPNGQKKQVQLLGHHRGENPNPSGSIIVKLPVSSYTERGVWFQVPKGYYIEALLIQSPNFPEKEGVFIITRPANPMELRKCPHPRHPIFI